MTSLQPPDQDVDTIDLTIRFSASLPDLLLSLPLSTHATSATLKHEIRNRLPAEYAKRRIRLIHAGKALVDETPLSITFQRSTSHAPSRSSTPLPADAGHGSKGKAPVRDPPVVSRIYIHCSIGDVVLSNTELTAEAALAVTASSPLSSKGDAPAEQEVSGSTLPAPRGFDRLLSSGFTASEVQNLRLQFLAVQARTHSPENMPSPAALRDLEDAWLDNSDNSSSALTTGVGGVEIGAEGYLKDILWGATLGFFWPIGYLLWAFREGGTTQGPYEYFHEHPRAVLIGVFMNIAVGSLRWGR